MRLNQVTVGATDFRQSVDFYIRMGLRLIVSAREEYARFDMPEGDATLSVHVQDEVPETGPMIYFEVCDVDAVVVRLRAAGIVFESDPVDQPWLWREAQLRDPAGNRLCIFHAGVNRRDPPWRLPVTD